MDHLIDIRELPAPEPLERALDALAMLGPDDCLLLLHRREPFPLYDMLRAMGYRWEVSDAGGDFLIRIEPIGTS